VRVKLAGDAPASQDPQAARDGRALRRNQGAKDVQDAEGTQNACCGRVSGTQSTLNIRPANHKQVAAPTFRTILDSVSLSVSTGEVVGLAGKSGVGKTTLMSCIMGAVVPACGHIECDGRVARVMQRPERQLFANTAFEDCAFGLRGQHLTQQDIDERVRRALEVMGLDAQEARVKSPFAYSGGEKRRLAIAGIIVTEPDYILMDEPTAGLDARQVEELLVLIAGLASGNLYDKKVGVLVSSHNSDFLWRACDIVYLLNAGQVTYDGLCAGLMQQPQVLEGAGVEVPPLAGALCALHDAGADVPPGAWESPECAAEVIVSIVAGAKGATSVGAAL
jgi:energy-coupling factor transport system ATP-binding protein